MLSRHLIAGQKKKKKKARPNSFVKIDGAQQVSDSEPAEDHAIDSFIDTLPASGSK